MLNTTLTWHWRWVWPKLALILVIIFLSSCSGLKLTPAVTSASKPLKLYNPGRNELHPDMVVYHSGSDESTLYIRLLTSELLFNQANPETKDQSRVKVRYQLYSSYSDQVIDQEGSQEFVINRDAVKNHYVAAVKLTTEEGKSYLLDVEVTDEIRQIASRQMILVDRFNPKSQQNFLLVNYPGNEVAFERYFYGNETFRVVTQNPPARVMRVAWYQPVQSIPLPPYEDTSVADTLAEPDSVWMMQTQGQSIYRLENPGVYLLYPDADRMNGAYVTNFGASYPQIITAAQMIAPLGYIASQAQLARMRESADTKAAIDEFWLELAGDFSKARELIRVYYNRVVFANLYFGSDRQGWMTDRGMIYVLMGPPDLVNKTESTEAWVYKIANSNQKYSFEFYLAPHPVTAYEFVLKRTEDHRVPWNMALQSWRDGRIFSLQ